MITLSMIVKNEERYLRECLESAMGVVDEIVLVDTGSTDSTIKIAEQFGAKIFHYKWNNDFASARNFALSKCRGDWILYLDADERLNKSSIDELKKLTSSKTKTGYYCRIYNIDNITNRPSVMSYVRLFANNPNIKFEGRVHEQIENSLFKNGYELKNSGIEIIHVGYSLTDGELKRKAERNYQILKTEYEERPNGYTAFQLGQTLHKLEKEEEAVNFFLLSLKDNSLRNEYKATACRSVAIQFAEKLDFNKAEEYIKKSITYDAGQPLTLLADSKIKFKQGRINESLTSVKRALRENSDYENGRKVSSQNILVDPITIIYNGLQISISAGDTANVNFFLNELKSHSSPDEYKLFAEIINKKELDISCGQFINSENLELLFTIAKKMDSKKKVITFVESIKDKFTNNAYFNSQFGLLLMEALSFDEAENAFKRSLEINSSDCSNVFYLISLNLQQQRLDKVKSVINDYRHICESNPQILSKLTSIEQKISRLL